MECGNVVNGTDIILLGGGVVDRLLVGDVLPATAGRSLDCWELLFGNGGAGLCA